jgi:hypothetical protein
MTFIPPIRHSKYGLGGVDPEGGIEWSGSEEEPWRLSERSFT